MQKKLPVCIQTGNWYDNLFGAEAGADKAFAFIKSCGFDTLDYNMDHAMTPSQINSATPSAFFDQSLSAILEYYRPVKEAAEKHGITLIMGHAVFPTSSENHPEFNPYIVQALIKQLAVCQYLGIPNLVVHPNVHERWETEWEMNIHMYTQLIPAAKEYGVKICLENMFSWSGGHATRRACADIATACKYIDTLNELAGQEVFGFCYDVGHANILSNNIYEDLKLLGRRLTVLHIHDNDGRVDMHCIPYFYKVSQKNSTDWESFLAALAEIDYQGPLNFETFAALMDVPHDLVPDTLKYINRIGRYFRYRLTGERTPE